MKMTIFQKDIKSKKGASYIQEQKRDAFPEGFDIYRSVKSHIQGGHNDNSKRNIWKLMEEKVDIQLKKPKRKARDEYEITEQKNRKNETIYVIKDLKENIYLSLNKEEFFVWELFDGDKTVKEICNIYFEKYKKLSNLPIKLIHTLEAKNMLKDYWWSIYDTVYHIQKRGLRQSLKRMPKFFLNIKFPLKNIDGFFSFIYKKFGWIFFRREAMYLYYILIAAGLFVFFGMGYFEQRFSLKSFMTSKLSIGILLFFSLSPVVLHELAHALTCKKYGRKVNKAGLMLYIGIPMLFVETTDIWLRPRKERMLVSLAGPFTDILVGSTCFLLHKLFGNVGILQVFPLVGLIAFIRCFYNFNPLLEFDGYYILMDLLDIPELRKKSFNFLKEGGVKRLLTRQKLERKEYIFLVYGVIASIYTYWMIFFMLYMWQTKIRNILVEIWEKQHSSIFTQILIFVALFFLLIRIVFLMKLLYSKFMPFLKRLYQSIYNKFTGNVIK